MANSCQRGKAKSDWSELNSFALSPFFLEVFRMSKTTVAPLLSMLLLFSAASAENWPNWRGPSSDSVVQGTGYPATWGEEENIAWKIKLPGRSGSTPVTWEDHIFLAGSLAPASMV